MNWGSLAVDPRIFSGIRQSLFSTEHVLMYGWKYFVIMYLYLHLVLL